MQKAFFKLLIVGAFVALFPLFLRRRCRVIRRTLIRANPEAIFPLLNDLRKWTSWTAWSRCGEVNYEYSGAPEGVGAEQRWKSGNIDGEMRITQSHPDERLAYELDMGEGRYHIEGMFQLEPVGTFTRVTWVCSWVGDPNPYARYLDMVFKVWIGRDFETGLANLRELVEKENPLSASKPALS
jgi:hypothetical protein